MDPELEEVAKMAHYAATTARRLESQMSDPRELAQLRKDHELVMQHLKDLSNVLSSVRMGNGSGFHPNDPDIIRVENIPGRRVEFDFLTEIPIAENDLSERQGTITIDQSGPFIAVERYCTFLSQFQAQFLDPESGEALPFLGRSNGRFRPVHSMWDIMDGHLPPEVVRAIAMPGTGDPSYASPSNHSPYRTMEFDGRLTIRAMSNSYPRSNISVPSCFWTTSVNSPFELGCLGFYGRAEVLDIRVTPTHVNNPPAGNLQGYGAGGVFPFLDSQYDHHEGISDPLNPALVAGNPDPVTRLPRGIFIVGLHGYRIIQPPGAVTNIGMT